MNLSTQQQKIAAVALLIAALLLVFGLLITPLFRLFIKQGNALTQLENQLTHYRRLSDELQQTEQRLQAIQKQNPDSDLYLPETTLPLASAWLQQHISTLVSHHGAQLVSIQNQPFNKQTPLPAIALGVHLRGEMDQLVPLFHRLESGRPMLFIDALVITTNPRQSAIRNNRNRVIWRRQNPGLQRMASLDIRFNLIGYSSREQP